MHVILLISLLVHQNQTPAYSVLCRKPKHPPKNAYFLVMTMGTHWLVCFCMSFFFISITLLFVFATVRINKVKCVSLHWSILQSLRNPYPIVMSIHKRQMTVKQITLLVNNVTHEITASWPSFSYLFFSSHLNYELANSWLLSKTYRKENIKIIIE